MENPETTTARLAASDVEEAIRERLRHAQRMRGDFAAIHAAPASPEEVPDRAGAQLVVLGAEHPHTDGAGDSPALGHAAALLAQASGGPRRYRNMLVFLAPDAARLGELRSALAAPGQADEALARLLGETWRWVLAPTRPASWRAAVADGREELAMRAARALRAGGDLFAEYPAARLRADLDRVPLWPDGQDHIGLAEVWESYASSVELPRLRSSAVLAAAILQGIATGELAYAESFDPDRRRFDGLVAGPVANLALKGSGLIVAAAAARAQLDAGVG